MPKVRSDGFERVVQTDRTTILLPEDVDALVALFRERYDRIHLLDDAINRNTQPTKEHPEPRLIYLESARDAPHPSVVIWQEPCGWEPRWTAVRPQSRTGLLTGRLGNPPPLRFETEMTRDVSDGRWYGQTGMIYRTDDEEARKFARLAWRLLAKVASDLAPLDGRWWGDVEKRYPKEELRKTGFWAGRHALARAEELGVPVIRVRMEP